MALELIVQNANSGPFKVFNYLENEKIVVAGDISSFVDRQTYVYGGYEQGFIDIFVAYMPKDKRRTILDVGANFGTHSLCFSRYFDNVHAFEPNPSLWETFQKNMAFNGFENVMLHRVGLADSEAELAFHLIEKNNSGLGTFSTIEQYDLPLKEICKAQVVVGDDYLTKHNINKVDAIKIDVQGFEPEVLRGLEKTLKRDRPIVWFEFAGGTYSKVNDRDEALRLFPENYKLYRFVEKSNWGLYSTSLEKVLKGELPLADYLAVPCS